MTVEVTFCVNMVDEDDVCMGENELDKNFEFYRSYLLAEYPHYGAVIINSPEQPEVRIEDELWVIVQSLCFQSLPKLIADTKVVYSYFSYSGNVVLNPSDTSVHISGEHIQSSTVLRDQLLISLYNCGQRFIKFLDRLKDNYPHEAVMKQLHEQAEVAKQVLVSQEMM